MRQISTTIKLRKEKKNVFPALDDLQRFRDRDLLYFTREHGLRIMCAAVKL
jgi:hypothetical protein